MTTEKTRFVRAIDSIFTRGGALLTLASILLIFPMLAYGAAVDLAWDTNSEPDLAGYKIYYGTASGNYSHSIDVGNTTQYTLTDLDEGVTYYLAATAYDTDDNESAYSTELVHTTAGSKTSNHNPDTPSTPSSPASGYPQTNYTVSTSASDPDDDEVEIRYDWGDESVSDWGAASQSHAWASAGNYCIKAQAKDSFEATSGWSDCKSIFISDGNNSEVVSISSLSPSHYEIASLKVGDIYYTDRTYKITSMPPEIEGLLGVRTANDDKYNSEENYISLVVDQDVTVYVAYDSTSISYPDWLTNFFNNTGLTINTTDVALTVWSKEFPAGTISLPGNQFGDPIGPESNYFILIDLNAESTYTITASSGANGSISPSGSVTVRNGADRTFTISAASKYHIHDVFVDGDSVGAVSSYTFANVTQNHTIAASFVIDNHSPIADAGADQSVRVTDTVQLDGSRSSDVDGDTLTFKWSFTTVPDGSRATLLNATAVNPTFVIDVSGTYIAKLFVNDGTATSQPDTVIISTENSPPVSDAGADQSVRVTDTVQLDGSGSSDADGNAVTFRWSFTAIPEGSGTTLSDTTAVNPEFEIDVPGTYTVQLIANDGTAFSEPDVVVITSENSPPVADAGADQSVRVTNTVQLDGSRCSDADGDALTFKWSFTAIPDGSSTALLDATDINPTFIIDVPGTYVAQLIVNDGTASSQADTVIISTENSPPVSDAGADQSARVTDTIQLDGSSSSDADGDTLTFEWSFTAIPQGCSATLLNATTVHPSFAVDVSGTYIVQLIVNDGTTFSQPDTLIINIENSPPLADAGPDQTVNAGVVVTLKGGGSSDPAGSIVAYSWSQTGGSPVELSNADQVDATFTAPDTGLSDETLSFELVVTDDEGLQTADSCTVYITTQPVIDSDGDGIPDEQDDFPYNADEYLDTDGDGEGNNADTDDDNDGMPDTWEQVYGLDPLKDDAADDPDGDQISNIDEYNQGSEPDYNESNLQPDAPQLMLPDNDEIVGLTPRLETHEFFDANVNDVHTQTQWRILRADNELVVFDVTTYSSLTSLRVPKLVLEEDTDYIWLVRFIDDQGAASAWSEAGYFTTEILQQDSDANGVLDHQEVDTTIDLDGDGIMDVDQSDIKVVATESGDFKVGISIRDTENAHSIIAIESESPEETDFIAPSEDAPNFLAFGLIHFKLLVDQPGDEVVVTIYLDKPAYDDGTWYKYDPVNDEWRDYSDFTEFSADRTTAYLTLTDGGFGDADGIANGIIVDPLALRTVADHNSGGSDFLVADIAETLDPTGTCFISSVTGRSSGGEIRGRHLSIAFILMVLAYIGKEISSRIKRSPRVVRKTSLMEGWRNSQG